MAFDDHPPAPGELSGLHLPTLPRPRYAIPTIRLIRPCARIEPETKSFEGIPTLVDRFVALTEQLPLTGPRGARLCRGIYVARDLAESLTRRDEWSDLVAFG